MCTCICYYRISDAPPTPEPRTVNTKALAIGCSVGGLALLGFVAFLVYMKKYRNMNVACKYREMQYEPGKCYCMK